MSVKFALSVALCSLLFACGENGDPPLVATCGNGIVEGDEPCDDGNAVDTDACSNTCTAAACGDGVVNFNEACDDGNQIDGDGCDANCQESYCGNGIMSGTEECDDGNRVTGDGCDNNCKPTGCGNGEQTPGEECDDGNGIEGDGCDSNCKSSACGNMITGGSETCDDGGTVSGDGCSATCNDEVNEMEPNDDGTPAVNAAGINGNDFATAAPDANGAITASATIIAAIDPAGDEDIFKLTNMDTVPERIMLDTWNVATGFDIGVSCGSSIDTGIQVKRADGTVIASNNDRSTSDRCSSVEIALFPGDSVYVQVVELGDNAMIAKYVLDVSIERVVCGDGSVGPSEECDDSNTAAGDGCSATCQIEGAVSEAEPNEDGTPSPGAGWIDGNDFGTAFPLNNGTIADDITLVGSLSPVGDEDIYAFTNLRPNNVTVKFDVWGLGTGLGVGVPCGNLIDTGLTIRDSSGGWLMNNDDRTFGDECSSLTLSLRPGETRFAQLVDKDDNTVIGQYALVVDYTDIVCGDNVIGLGEECDDGNSMSGDGCSSTCQIEPFCGDNIMQPAEWCDDGNMTAGDGCSPTCEIEGAVEEVEPNEDGTPEPFGGTTEGNDFAIENADMIGAFTGTTRIAARIQPLGDEDVFAFRNPGTSTVIAHFDIWNNGPGFGIGVTCGTSTFDSVMQVRDAAGNSLAWNDDRNDPVTDWCSRVIYPIQPGETVYVHVFDRSDDGTFPSYTLDAVYEAIPCGDGIVGVGEQCDDLNITNGDGCNSSCQLENAVTETEPNDDGSTDCCQSGISGNDFSSTNANGPFTGSKRIIGSIDPWGDEDVYKITNPLGGNVQVRFDIWDLEPGLGFGVPCGSAINTGLQIRNAAGASLASNDDRDGASDRCSGLTFTLAAGQTVYAQVMARDDDTIFDRYALDMTFTPIICGDGLLGPTEQCDDGNTTAGDGCNATCQWELVCGNGVLQAPEQCDDANGVNNDGCSSTCTIENRVTEVEPDDSSSDADASTVQISGNAVVAGDISVSGDVDRYKVTVSTPTAVRFETFTTWGDCSTATIDLRLFDSASNPITTDLVGSGIKECGAIVMYLDAGSYYVQVEERGNNSTISSYLLQVSFLTSAGNEVEPNETTAQASTALVNKNETFVFGDHTMGTDVDVYAITVPPNGHIRAEVIEGDRMTETCESGNVDSRVLLYNDALTLIAEDNDTGRGFCSLLDGTGSSPLDPTARNTSTTSKTYYLMVRASQLATPTSGQFVYRLAVTVR